MAEVCINVEKMKRKLHGIEYGELVYEDDEVSIYVVITLRRKNNEDEG